MRDSMVNISDRILRYKRKIEELTQGGMSEKTMIAIEDLTREAIDFCLENIPYITGNERNSLAGELGNFLKLVPWRVSEITKTIRGIYSPQKPPEYFRRCALECRIKNRKYGLRYSDQEFNRPGTRKKKQGAKKKNSKNPHTKKTGKTAKERREEARKKTKKSRVGRKDQPESRKRNK